MYNTMLTSCYFRFYKYFFYPAQKDVNVLRIMSEISRISHNARATCGTFLYISMFYEMSTENRIK